MLEGVEVGVTVGEEVDEGVAVRDGAAVIESVGVAVGEGVAVSVGGDVGVAVVESVGVTVGEFVAVPEGVLDGVAVDVWVANAVKVEVDAEVGVATEGKGVAVGAGPVGLFLLPQPR